MKPLCIYHGNCADGFTAAWAVWKRFGDTFEYHAGVYGQPAPETKGRDVVIVDFSYKRPALLEMAKSAHSVLILDHHKTALEDLAGLPPPINGNDWDAHIADLRGLLNDGTDPHLPRAVFDMERSGAGVTWDFFHPREPRPTLVNYVEDRDLWRFKLEDSREHNANIFSYEYTFENWDVLAEQLERTSGLALSLEGGAAIERKHHKDVAELVAALKRDMVIGGHRVPVCNIPYTLTSDAGNLMCKQWNGDMYEDGVTAALPPFAACYWDTPKGRVFSLRSVGDFDVSAVAAQYGGGGHKNASGFTLPHGVNP